MIRALVELAVIIGIYFFIREIMGGGKKGKSSPNAGKTQPQKTAEDLVQDPHCGVYVPKTQAVKGPSGTWFCSETCLKAHLGKG